MRTNRIGNIVSFVVPLAMLQACAYNRPAEVTAQMARTETTIQQAQQSGAEVNSLPELQLAKDKYADAQKALEKNSKEGDRIAMQLAQQAQVDAQHASAKSQSTRQQDAAIEAENGVEALRDETTRTPKSPDTQSTPASHSTL